MTKSPLTTVFIAALFISAVASVGFCWAYISRAMELRNLQGQVMTIQSRRAFLTSLANDTIEYSKKDSRIDPILESAGVKQRPSSSPASNKPAAK